MDIDRSFAAIGARFRATHDFARRQGLAGGYPNFNFAPGPLGTVFGSLLLRDSVAGFRDVRAAEIGHPPFDDIGARFRALHVFARSHGAIGALPNFHSAGSGDDLVYGTMLLKENVAEFRDVPAAELGHADVDDISLRFRVTHDYARRNGFMAGFPNFFFADTPNGRVYGTILIREQDVEFRDLSSKDLFPQVFGAIGERWLSDGGILSPLGFPTSDELNFDDGGKVRFFSGGAMYWWKDLGALPLPGNTVKLRYTGLNCFAITDGPGADDPHLVLNVSSPQPSLTLRTDVYPDIVPGRHTRDDLLLYQGPPAGLSVHAIMMERDHGDPDKYRDAVKEFYEEARPRIAGALMTIPPPVGPVLGVAAEATLRAFKGEIVDFLNGLFGTGDDRLGDDLIVLSPRQIVHAAATASMQQEGGVDFTFQSRLFEGRGSSYKAAFVLSAAR